MITQLFNSVYVDNQATVSPYIYALSLLTSLVLGVCLAQFYKYKTLYTRDFVILLAILPSLISSLIFLVNGNLGTSVAVAGAFSLVRFRTAAGGAKESLFLFMAMGIGLATGTGYLLLAVCSAFFLLAAVLLLEMTGFAKTNQLRRQISVTVPMDFHYELLLEAILEKTCQFIELSSIKTKAKKQTLILEYLVDLKPEVSDKDLIQELLAYKDDLEVSVSRVAGKKKSL